MEKLKDMAVRIAAKTDDMAFIRIQENRALMRIADGLGGTMKLMSRQALESIDDYVDAIMLL